MKRYELTEEEASEIKAAVSKYHDPHIQRRLRAMEMRIEGRTNAEIHKATGFSAVSIIKFIRKYREGGLERITTLRYQEDPKERYPIIITKTECLVSVFVPDFDITVQGKNEDDAIRRTQDIVGFWVASARLNHQPKAPQVAVTEPETIVNATVSEIEIDVTQYRNRPEAKSVTQTLTVPRWLDEEARRAGMHLSQIYREALKRELFSKQEKE